jgi:eukaryotic-like serine/threonine-protein kinase
MGTDVPEKRTQLNERYELKQVLGRGGMGVVYRAYDNLMRRDVALKTLIEIDNPAIIALFYKEWSVLANMVHPNVISIYDIGEFEQDGVKKPFFVMPLLPGASLDKLIQDASARLSVRGVLEIIDQAARGLHAAHEQGLVHRDVKPSNIFVMDDNSVKIIDFGIAREASGVSRTTLKGTLHYMAPEQLQMKPPSPLSDLYALAVVTYEALTRRRPFQGATESEVAEAIIKSSPPPVSELNHEVSYAISQVVYKAMAKQPWHRFTTVREFADSLQKAMRGEPIEFFDTTRIKPRLERAAKSFREGDYTFASELLSELEAEGHLDPDLILLRGQVDQAVRQSGIRQVLDSARRFFEAGEYPLSLRKIQEALELDPSDSGALALKSQVEKERRAKKISEWLTLARQHLNNLAFGQARDALDNVLQLRPNDADALALLAEIGRKEAEFSRIREEKSRLYHAAVEAWEKGEVTSAMSKLEVLVGMERDQPETDSGRSSTYQKFYSQVRSEHDAIRNSFDEARRNLAADNFEAAAAICKENLAKYPGHALFQALKFDVETRQRQKLSSVIAETDRRIEEEPDLDRRMGILDEVMKLYPGESHFERALRTVHDKRDLVNSIVAKARFFEERGQFTEALDQWQILKSIHDKYPGLLFEIERLVKRQDQQAHEKAKARWVEQTDKALEAGDYDRAVQTVDRALVEFPADPELLELSKLVYKSQERGRQAMHLLDLAREASDRGSSDDALEALREAYKLDSRSAVVRTVLVNSLIEQARRLVETDWEAADCAVQEALTLDPKHVPAQSLVSRIADRKREDFVSWCLAQARRAQTQGDIAGALSVVGQGRSAWPNEPRLQQLQATLQRAQAAESQAPAAAPQGPGASQGPGAGGREPGPVPIAPPAKPSQPIPPSQPVARPHEDTLFLDATNLDATSVLGPGAEPRASASGPTSDPRSPIPTPAPSPKSPVPAVSPAPGPRPQAPKKPPAPKKAPRYVLPTNRILQAVLAAAAVIVLVAGGITLSRRFHKAPPVAAVPGKVRVSLRATPSGAQIKLNGEVCGTSFCDLDLVAGAYEVQASLPGYESTTAKLNVQPGSTPPQMNLALQPSPPRIAISTDLTEGSVQFDGNPAGQIQDSAFEIPSVAPGHHDLIVQSGAARASVSLEIASGELPKLAGNLDATGLRTFVVAQQGIAGHIYSNTPGLKVTLDGNALGTLDATGLDLQNLTAGRHELAFDGPAGQHDLMVFDAQPAPVVYASLRTSRNVGSLRIESNEDDADVFINGQAYRRKTASRPLVIYEPPKQYTIRVQKDGFAPQEQTVDLKTGDEAKLTFKLSPAKATLAIHHAPPGAEVFVDGNRVGAAAADGSFTSSDLEPGRHTISLRRDNFKPLESVQLLAPGKTLDVEAAMDTLLGTLSVEVTPASARLRLHRDGETGDRPMSGTNITLAEGNYTLTGSAPQYQEGSTTFHVTAGQRITANLTLRPEGVTKKAAPSPAVLFSLADWLKMPGWTPNDKAIQRRGGDFVLASPDLSTARITFSIVSIKGKRLEWVAAYRDPKNYYLFEADDKNLTRYEYNDGKRSDPVKVPLRMDPRTYIDVSITISAKGIQHEVVRDQKWQVVDNWEISGGPARGKFGFLVPGKDEISLADFKLTAQ